MFGEQQGFDITSLNLTGVKAATGGSVLPPGRHACYVKSVKLVDTKAKDGSKMLEILFVEVNDKGVITGRLNIHNVKSPKATEIGMEQLKALAVSAGMPDPDQPFAQGINSMNGKVVGVVVGSEMYLNEPRSTVKAFCDPASIKASAGATPSGPIGDDDLPF